MQRTQHNWIILAVAAIATTLYLQIKLADMQRTLHTCESNFENFKNGLNYGSRLGTDKTTPSRSYW